jgi:C4-dicarboxylate-specific signal transduction histidine kinase
VLAQAESDRTRTIEVEKFPVKAIVGVVGSCTVLKDRTEARRVEQQLHQAQKLEAIGYLTAGIAHGINNPLAFLNSNLGSLEELAERLADDGVQEALGPKHADLAAEAPEIVAEMKDGLDRIARLVETLIHTSLEPVPPVLGREDELVQIATNLLLNAIDASGDVPEIELEVRGDRGQVTLSVRDRGPGIPDESLPHVFDPFFSTKGLGEGAGLGLSLSFDLARRHGGTLEAANRPGGGAVFTLWLAPAPGREPERTDAWHSSLQAQRGADPDQD